MQGKTIAQLTDKYQTCGVSYPVMISSNGLEFCLLRHDDKIAIEGCRADDRAGDRIRVIVEEDMVCNTIELIDEAFYRIRKGKSKNS